MITRAENTLAMACHRISVQEIKLISVGYAWLDLRKHLSGKPFKREKTFEDMMDQRSYAHNLSSCEIKA